MNGYLFALQVLEWSLGNWIPFKGARRLPRVDLFGSGRDTTSPTAPVIKESGLSMNFLDASRIHIRHNQWDCPLFDGNDFLGWFMKIQQFFEATGVKKEEKIN